MEQIFDFQFSNEVYVRLQCRQVRAAKWHILSYMQIRYTASIVPKGRTIWLLRGVEDFLQPKEKDAAYNREKKRALKKKFLHVNLLKLFTVLYPQACKILHFWAGTFA
jgi:hypothetical protein